MEGALILLVGWLPDECEGRDLLGSIAESTSRVVTKKDIEAIGKKIGPPEGYYQIKLGGSFASLTKRNIYSFFFLILSLFFICFMLI